MKGHLLSLLTSLAHPGRHWACVLLHWLRETHGEDIVCRAGAQCLHDVPLPLPLTHTASQPEHVQSMSVPCCSRCCMACPMAVVLQSCLQALRPHERSSHTACRRPSPGSAGRAQRGVLACAAAPASDQHTRSGTLPQSGKSQHSMLDACGPQSLLCMPSPQKLCMPVDNNAGSCAAVMVPTSPLPFHPDGSLPPVQLPADISLHLAPHPHSHFLSCHKTQLAACFPALHKATGI